MNQRGLLERIPVDEFTSSVEPRRLDGAEAHPSEAFYAKRPNLPKFSASR
jgi:hypothetical protein